MSFLATVLNNYSDINTINKDSMDISDNWTDDKSEALQELQADEGLMADDELQVDEELLSDDELGYEHPDLDDVRYREADDAILSEPAEDSRDVPPPSIRDSNWQITHEDADIVMTDPLDNDYKFTSHDAFQMLHERRSIDYAESEGSKPVTEHHLLYPTFNLDFFSVIGQPFQVISGANVPASDGIEFSFKQWSKPYAGKHINRFNFNPDGRTFYLGKASTREDWFLMLQPLQPDTPAPRSEIDRTKASTRRTAVTRERAEHIVAFIKKIFIESNIKVGMEESWKLSGSESRRISALNWRSIANDRFWGRHEPCFHAYDFGANIQITADDQEHRDTDSSRRIRVREYNDNQDAMRQIREESISTAEQLGIQSQPASWTPSEDEAPEPSIDLSSYLENLDKQYSIRSISSISYALAVNLECREPDDSIVALLANREVIRHQYSNQEDFTFYPLGFHPRYGNFQSKVPPQALQDRIYTGITQQMQHRHDANAVTFGAFQGYSNIKRAIRYSPRDLLAARGSATAALAIPCTQTAKLAKHNSTHQKLLARMEGPDCTRPFAREVNQINAAVRNNNFSYRFEQVISIRVESLGYSSRKFDTIAEPILAIIEAYQNESDIYTPFLHCFQPTTFPGILSAYGTVIDTALEGMLSRFRKAGPAGLDMTLCEGIAALDRLGHYCFTGDESVLPALMRYLGTKPSLRRHGWPYIDPGKLDMRKGRPPIDHRHWPMNKDGKPALMHVASLRYHYSPAVALARQTLLWFREIGFQQGNNERGASEATAEMIFRDMYIPDIVAFISKRVKTRRPPPEQQNAIKQWASHPHPLSDEYTPPSSPRTRRPTLTSILPSALTPTVQTALLGSATPETVQTKVTQQTTGDLARLIYRNTLTTPDRHIGLIAPTASEWIDALKGAFSNSPFPAEISEKVWVAILARALHTCRIQWIPGTDRQRMVHTRIIRLQSRGLEPPPATAPPGSVKRQVQEAAIAAEMRKAREQDVINIGYPIPFQTIPDNIAEGFERSISFIKDPPIKQHYRLARTVLEGFLGRKECDLMLMIALTFAASSELPYADDLRRNQGFIVAPGGKDKKQKESQLGTIALIIRMLWVLDPDSFPRTARQQAVTGALSIQEMTKKIGINTYTSIRSIQ
ncbi:hypothetical protein FIE12Z_12270 [Fusarium flagelliforme]|uniref:Uncharacterized protein n=1 Tax=Fusarium flagelliforme TaxID=2675880 RepID=A0A395M859_9HYPO|nr:hypothetical protein FIE12Z_12270 [Fusarium flagelliforme]